MAAFSRRDCLLPLLRVRLPPMYKEAAQRNGFTESAA